MYSSSRHHKECRSKLREADRATRIARDRRREKEKQVILLQAQNDFLVKRRELNTFIYRSRQAAEDKVTELEDKAAELETKLREKEATLKEKETKLKEKEQNELLLKRRELNLLAINNNSEKLRKAAETKVAKLENKLKEKDLLLKRKEQNIRTMNSNNDRLRKIAEHNVAVLQIELDELAARPRMLPSYVQVHDANEKLEKEKEKHAETLQSLQNTMDKYKLLQEEYHAQGVRLTVQFQTAEHALAEKKQAFEDLRAQKDREIYIQAQALKRVIAQRTLTDSERRREKGSVQSQLRDLNQQLQLRDNSIQEMNSKNTELEKQLSSRDKQISDLERNKEFQYLNRKKQYEEIVCLKRRIEELEDHDDSLPTRKRRRS